MTRLHFVRRGTDLVRCEWHGRRYAICTKTSEDAEKLKGRHVFISLAKSRPTERMRVGYLDLAIDRDATLVVPLFGRGGDQSVVGVRMENAITFPVVDDLGLVIPTELLSEESEEATYACHVIHPMDC
jgi:hypothetical protein